MSAKLPARRAAGALALACALLSSYAPAQQPPSAPIAPTASAPPSAAAAAPAPAGASQIIDLPTVLRLAGLNDLDLALVREAEKQARAANDAATLRFFPWLSAGASYAKQTGAAQEVGGQMLSVDQQLYQRGVAANLQVELGSAIFEKLAARQRQQAAGFDVEASRNDTALAAAGAYFDLVNAVAATDIAHEAVRISQDYEGQLERAYQAGLTNRSEFLRVGVQTQRNRVVLREAEAALRSAAAALATLLRLDPAGELQPIERIVSPPTLIEVDTPVGTLVKDALAFRPELKSSAASVAAADKQRVAATYGPLVPSLSGQAALGQLRGGPNGMLSDYMTAHDYVVALNWRFGPGGLFDFSRTAAANSALQSARLSAEKLHDLIAEEVVQSYEAARAGLDQMGLARRAVELADQSLKLSEQRREFGVYAVLEVIQAQQDLTQARGDYARALTQYAKAQYALAHATARIGG
ncbi:MAG TPA: TolC family protein [Steroidobacteraceae bacterium]|nr:TolC family protein [Steroidobacteraceae bacterium]